MLIAAVSAAAKDWETAKFFFDQAISKDPRDYRAYLGRSVLVSSQIAAGENADREVIAQGRKDASMVLELIEARGREFEKRRSELAQKSGVYWQRGVSAEEEDAAELGDMKSDRVKALEERGRFHLFLRDLEDAKADGEKLIELAPESPKGYQIAGAAEIFLGQEALGRTNLERAHSMRTGGGRK